MRQQGQGDNKTWATRSVARLGQHGNDSRVLPKRLGQQGWAREDRKKGRHKEDIATRT